ERDREREGAREGERERERDGKVEGQRNAETRSMREGEMRERGEGKGGRAGALIPPIFLTLSFFYFSSSISPLSLLFSIHLSLLPCTLQIGRGQRRNSRSSNPTNLSHSLLFLFLFIYLPPLSFVLHPPFPPSLPSPDRERAKEE